MFTIVLNEINLERHHFAFSLTILKVESKEKNTFTLTSLTQLIKS